MFLKYTYLLLKYINSEQNCIPFPTALNGAMMNEGNTKYNEEVFVQGFLG